MHASNKYYMITMHSLLLLALCRASQWLVEVLSNPNWLLYISILGLPAHQFNIAGVD